MTNNANTASVFQILQFLLALTCMALIADSWAIAGQVSAQHVFIAYEGADQPTNYARGDARQLAVLLGHFAVDYKLEAVQNYKSGDFSGADQIFFIGFTKKCDPPDRFMRDVFSTNKS